METPLVSVCMTTYNHEAYLRQAVESILAQETSFDVELVLGDDCSADSTAAICREYAAKYPGRVRFVTGERNVGWRANYRRTFEACRGKYVAYCDGDDWWSDPRKLQMQADLLESDPSCGMCYTRASNYYQNTGLTEPDHEEHFTDFDRLLCRLTIANCATLARRDLIARYYAEVRPDEHPEWLTDDAPMWLWFAVCSRVRYLPAITAVHRRLPQSVSHSTEYPRRIAFCDSLMDISLWFDARYGARRNRFRILRRRSSVALWVLSWNGSVGEYVIAWFSEHMPVAESELHYTDPYQLLVAVILSAQCTDKRVNMTTPALFERFPTPFEMAKATAEEIYPYIRSISYPNNKARNLAGMARMLCEEFGGEVPSDLQQMQRLPGVGRKTANVLGAVLWQKEVMPVDTHVFRVSNRIGLTTNSKTPLQTELTLEKNIPSHLLPVAHHWLILHGRYVCMARSPKCGECGIAAWCRKYAADHRTKG